MMAVPMSISMSDTENPRDVATVMVSTTHLRASKRTSGIAVSGRSVPRNTGRLLYGMVIL
jgi:hypothetical protein